MSVAATEPVARREPPALAALLLALPLLAMGAFIVGIGLGWVPCEPNGLLAPPWVVVVCGAVFASGGVGVLATALGHGRRVTPVVSALVLAGLMLVCHWIAFAGGERRFTSTSYHAGFELQRSVVDERTGRTAFAFAAVSVDVLLLMVAARAWRARTRPADELGPTPQPLS